VEKFFSFNNHIGKKKYRRGKEREREKKRKKEERNVSSYAIK